MRASVSICMCVVALCVFVCEWVNVFVWYVCMSVSKSEYIDVYEYVLVYTKHAF